MFSVMLLQWKVIFITKTYVSISNSSTASYSLSYWWMSERIETELIKRMAVSFCSKNNKTKLILWLDSDMEQSHTHTSHTWIASNNIFKRVIQLRNISKLFAFKRWSSENGGETTWKTVARKNLEKSGAVYVCMRKSEKLFFRHFVAGSQDGKLLFEG